MDEFPVLRTRRNGPDIEILCFVTKLKGQNALQMVRCCSVDGYVKGTNSGIDFHIDGLLYCVQNLD